MPIGGVGFFHFSRAMSAGSRSFGTKPPQDGPPSGAGLLDPGDTRPARKPGFTLSLKGRALRLLSNREHSRKELERKLAPHEETPGELQQALDELQAKGFISDERAVESVIHRRASRLGMGRLKQELQAKGLDATLVSQAMETLKGTELERAREVWRRRFADQPPRDAAERAKQSRFLAARGFGGEVIRKVLAGGAGEAD